MSMVSIRIASLLFFSGLCALIYQTTWLRELRLVFGASTPASAAVLAVFMGGLGAGSLLLGKRAEESPNPLQFYAHLEIGISLSAALSPFLLWAARQAYIAMGGSIVLGVWSGTVIRLLLSAAVLLPPTLLMGGTLPAAARAATDSLDVGRRNTALLYGLNTLGAVTGAFASTFIMLEIFGTRMTLWMGCLVNLLVAVVARAMSRKLQPEAPASESKKTTPAEDANAEGDSSTEADSSAPPEGALTTMASQTEEARAQTQAIAEAIEKLPETKGAGSNVYMPFVLAASAASGFVFLVMELVWYRMLSPLLGGSSYTFGLILAVALLGIGLGGLIYSGRAHKKATIGAFAMSCALEALAMALAYALGDRIAWLALLLLPMGSVGLSGNVVGWTVVTMIVVFPAALVAGYQFPLLIALLGQGKASLSRHVGVTYAFNTLGAIVGSLAGGFLLMPWLGALGCWLLTIWILVLLGIGAALLQLQSKGASRKSVIAPTVVALSTALLVYSSTGPTAFWRHSPIGAGRARSLLKGATRNSIRRAVVERNRAITWETDGRESSIGLYTLSDTSFLVSGKSDGSARSDGGTQVMGGLIGAMMHKQGVKKALVVGLGTGSTAGWLAKLPDIERVDVVELEPAIRHVAEACHSVNADVLKNPKVNLIIGDAREVLLTTPQKYDLIFSEPSNPYRAGIASLFTKEFYEAAASRLKPGGQFIQWLQAYEIDASTVEIVYATLNSVFGSIESWRTQLTDLVLISRAKDEPLDIDLLQRRIKQKPYAEALFKSWRADTVEDFLARFLARPSLARAIAKSKSEHSVNTDDLNMLEFAVARSLGQPLRFGAASVARLARRRNEHRPVLAKVGRKVDWSRVDETVFDMAVLEQSDRGVLKKGFFNQAATARIAARNAWRNNQWQAAANAWFAQKAKPRTHIELMVVADILAVTGTADEELMNIVAQLRKRSPVEADCIEGRMLMRKGDPAAAWQSYKRAFLGYRTNPWPHPTLLWNALNESYHLVTRKPELADEVFEVLKTPFAAYQADDARRFLLLDVATLATKPDSCVEAVGQFGRWFPWMKKYLEKRVACYERRKHPELVRAREELAEYLRNAGSSFGRGIPSPSKPRAPRSTTRASARAVASGNPAPPAAPSGSAVQSSVPTTQASAGPSASSSSAPPAPSASAPGGG